MKIKEVENLKKLLDYHNNLYYNKDTPEISDPEYDALKAKYIEVSGQEYDYVPGEAQFSKAKHLYSVRSLGKVNTLEDLHKEMERLVPFVIEPKFDGLTLVAYDTDTMVTRGDGIVGELVTSTAKHIENLKKVSEYIPKGAGIRMEVFMTKDAFKSINSEREEKGLKLFKNARNAAAGILRSKDTTNTDKLTYMAYNVLGSTASETVQLEWLCDNGFLTTEFYCCDTKEGIDDAIEFVKDFDREDLEYEIDGLVIKSNKPDSLALYGETGHHPKNAVAYKFPAEGKWTKLKGITWQVGRTGKITPVAELEPVDIGGSAITRATLHNRAIIKVLGITEGCEVFVIKANDVIPAIINVRNINPLRKIKDCIICPECGSELVEEGDQLYCKNAECSAQLSNQIVHMASRDALNIEGLSTETVNKILDKFSFVVEPWDILKLTRNDIQSLPGFAEKSSKKLHDAILNSMKDVEFKRFLYAAGVPLIGRHASEQIADKFCSFESFYIDILDGCKEIATLEDFGDKMIKSILNNNSKWLKLLNYVTPLMVIKTPTVAPANVLTFVITGTLDRPRYIYEDIIKMAGHKVSGSVSKKTDYVLVGDEPGSKYTKAIELNIPTLRNEEELRKAING